MKKPSKPGEISEIPAAVAWGDLAGVALISAAVFGYAHFQALANPYVINDDIRQQIYWMQQWLDPELFQGDVLSDYARHYVTWGVKGLYWLASWLVGPIYFSKVLTGVLFVSLSLCIYKIGQTLSGRRLGWLAVGVSWLMPFFLDNLSGSMARAFAAPLLALFWLGWLKRQPWVMGLALVLQGLFIPYIFMVCAGAVLLGWLAGRVGLDSPPPFLVRPAHFLLLGAAAVLVGLMALEFNAAGYGPLVSAGEMLNRPEFYGQGRFPILPVPSIFWELISPWAFNAPFRDLGAAVGGLVLALVLCLAAWGARRVDWRLLAPSLPPVLYLGLASLGLFFLARVMLFKLFMPDRYLSYTLNLFYCLLLALCLGAGLGINRWPKGLAVAALVLVAVLGGWRLQWVGLKDYSAYKPLYAALAQVPKDAMLAGHPNVMDNIPTFARRRALVTYELAHVWSKGYWERLQPRFTDLFRAYYAADPEEVLAFCRKYQISFLVVDDRHFTPEFLAGGRFLVPLEKKVPQNFGKTLADRVDCPFFAPFDEQIRRQVGERPQFALLSAPIFHPLKVDEHVRLLDMRPWLTKD